MSRQYQIDTVIVNTLGQQIIGPTPPFTADGDPVALRSAREILAEAAEKLEDGERFTDARVSRLEIIGRIDTRADMAA